jgi:glycosyltransferase involved in cell wall biosynthesis
MQSGVVLFAMSYGVPVLTSNLDGMLEVVEHGYTGLTFEQGSVSDLTDRILEIENGDWPLSKIVEQANNQIDKHYAWAQCAIQTSAVYRQIAYD